jgi:tripeptidyl-peptidase-1
MQLLLVLASLLIFLTPLHANERVKLEQNSLFHRRNWVLHATNPIPCDDHTISVILALKQSNVAALEKKFHSVSIPTHPEYGQHLSLAEVNQLVKPSIDSVALIMNWLINDEDLSPEQLSFISPDFLQLTATVAQINRVFHVKLRRWVHSHTAEEFVRDVEGYSVPHSVAKHLDFVGGISRLHKTRVLAHDLGRDLLAAEKAPVPAKYNVTPAFLRNLYQIPDGLAGTNLQNSQCVVEFLGQYYDDDDLQAFFKMFNVPPQKVAKIIGPNNSTNPGGEAQLDIEARQFNQSR